MKPRIAVSVALVVLLAAGVGYWRVRLYRRAPEVTYRTAAVEKRHIVGRVTASGTLSALVTVVVGTQVSGRIQKLYADFNSQVKKGELVAKIDPSLFEASVQQAQANFLSAKAGVATAEANALNADKQYARTKALHDENLAARADLDTAEANVATTHAGIDAAKAAVAQSAASLHQAEVNLSYTNIISPIDGVVISRSVDTGQTVAASLSAPTLFTIAQDLTKMQVDTNVAEGDVGRLEVGMKTYFTVDSFPGQRFMGKIRQIRNAATTVQNVVTYDAVIDVDNSDLRLRPGMTANVTVVYAERKSALAVSNAALRFRPPASPAASAAPSASGQGRRHGKPSEARGAARPRCARCATPLGHARKHAAVGPCSHRAFGRDGDRGGRRRRGRGRFGRRRRRQAQTVPRRRPPPAILLRCAAFFDPCFAPMADPVISLTDVTKIYQTGDIELRALDNVSLRVDAGEFIAIMGASGSGKSTLMNIIGCLDRPTTGSYELTGRSVAGMSRGELAKIRNRVLGFVFQQFNLLARTTALENVELPLEYAGVGFRDRRRRAREALERVGLAKRLEHHPNQLSGGQQQRVAIARAIVNDPKVILADEPTGALDSRTSVDVMAIFQKLWRTGITVVLVTHEADVAEFASRVVHMKDGRVLSDTRQEPKIATPAQAEAEGGP